MGISLQLIPFGIQVQPYTVTFLSIIIDNVISGKQWKAIVFSLAVGLAFMQAPR